MKTEGTQGKQVRKQINLITWNVLPETSESIVYKLVGSEKIEFARMSQRSLENTELASIVDLSLDDSEVQYSVELCLNDGMRLELVPHVEMN